MAEEVGIDIYADTRQADRSVDKLTDRVESLEDAADDVNDAFEDTKKAVPTFQRLSGAIKVAIGALAVKETVDFGILIAETTDQVNRLDAQLTILSGRSAAFDQVTKSANDLGISIEDATRITAQFVIAGKSIGLLTEDAIRLSNTIVQLGSIGGKSVQEVSDAAVQLTQGLSKGRLDGDELTSVLENLPLVADRIAIAIGRDRSELRDLGAEGKLTAQVITDALLGATEEVNEQFALLPQTLQGAKNRISNELSLLARQIGNTFQVPQAFTAALDFATGKIREFREILAATPEERFALGRIDKTVEEIEEAQEALEVLQARARVFEGRDIPAGSSAERRYAEINEQIVVQQSLIDDLNLRVGRYAKNIQDINAAQEETLRIEEEQEKKAAEIARLASERRNTEKERAREQKEEARRERERQIAQRQLELELLSTQQEEERWQRVEEIHQREFESARDRFDKLLNLNLTAEERLRQQRDQRLIEVQELQDALYITEFEGAKARAEIEQNYTDEVKDLDEQRVDSNQVATDLATAAIQNASDIWARTFLDNEQNFDEMIEGMLKNLAKLAAELLIFQPLIQSVSGALGSGGAGAGLGVPSFQTGTPYVPRDGLAYLHRGEKVIPANKNVGSTVNIYEAPPGTTVEQTQGPTGEELIEVVIGRINNEIVAGTTHNVLSNTFNLRRQGIVR